MLFNLQFAIENFELFILEEVQFNMASVGHTSTPTTLITTN